MDFLREPLSRYYLSKEELFSKYDIPTDKKVILFASPYYGDCLTKEYIAGMCEAFGEDWPEYYKFMCDSQRIVLEWFEKICIENQDMIAVFRPHPGHPSIAADELAKRCDNFRIISGESVKQWIIVCDKVYTGNSSVVVEAFFARKMCQLLFPLPVTPGFELQLIEDSDKLMTYEEFRCSVFSGQEKFPTPTESIENIYLIDWKTPNYIKFANMAEEVLRDDYYRLTKRQLKEYKEYSFVQSMVRGFIERKALYCIYLGLLRNRNLKWPILEHQRRIREESQKRIYDFEKQHTHELTSEKEINDIIDRIRHALEDKN